MQVEIGNDALQKNQKLFFLHGFNEIYVYE